MKILISILFLFISINADEMQRIENIVNDISKLRVEYDECKTALKEQNGVTFKAVEYKDKDNTKKYETLIQSEKVKNSKLAEEISSLKEKNSTNDSLKKEIVRLEAVIKNQENTIQTKEKFINDLESQKNTKEKIVFKEKLVTQTVVCKKPENTNVFPKLEMKENSVVKKIETPSIIEETVIEVEAGVYRLNNDSTIYDAINGNETFYWEKERSFTSNFKSENWVKITGYFTDKQWHPSEKELWIMLKEVIKR